jgi:hypothetical protein
MLTYKLMTILMMETRMKRMTRKEKPQLSLKAKLPPKSLRRMEMLKLNYHSQTPFRLLAKNQPQEPRPAKTELQKPTNETYLF